MEQIHYSVTVTEPVTEPDRRYRMLVMLARSDRPNHWKFHCPKCQKPVAELVNHEVIGLSDVIDMESSSAVGIRCDGRFEGARCGTWFYYSLGEK